MIDQSADRPLRNSFEPQEVRLVIEVVSPGTETIDRSHKHAEYRDAKVPHYWRVEIQPEISVHTYQLSETGVYLETGVFRSRDVVVAPGLAWAKIAVDDLVVS